MFPEIAVKSWSFSVLFDCVAPAHKAQLGCGGYSKQCRVRSVLSHGSAI